MLQLPSISFLVETCRPNRPGPPDIPSTCLLRKVPQPHSSVLAGALGPGSATQTRATSKKHVQSKSPGWGTTANARRRSRLEQGRDGAAAKATKIASAINVPQHDSTQVESLRAVNITSCTQSVHVSLACVVSFKHFQRLPAPIPPRQHRAIGAEEISSTERGRQAELT